MSNEKSTEMTKAQVTKEDNEKLNRWSNLAKARGEKGAHVAQIINRLVRSWERSNKNEEYPKEPE